MTKEADILAAPIESEGGALLEGLEAVDHLASSRGDESLAQYQDRDDVRCRLKEQVLWSLEWVQDPLARHAACHLVESLVSGAAKVQGPCIDASVRPLHSDEVYVVAAETPVAF